MERIDRAALARVRAGVCAARRDVDRLSLDHARGNGGADPARRSRGVWRSAPFRRLFAARTASQWGDTFNTVAIVILVYRISGSGVSVAATVVFEIVPVVALGFVAVLGETQAIAMCAIGILFIPQFFRITRAGATAALVSPQLEGPNGITWDSKGSRFVIVSFLGKGIYGWRPGEKDVKGLGAGPGQFDGVLVLPDGRLLVTSWADSSLFVLEKGLPRKVATGIASPADIGFDEKDSRVAVPQLLENKVQFWELP